jgi:hypothetical protein
LGSAQALEETRSDLILRFDPSAAEFCRATVEFP